MMIRIRVATSQDRDEIREIYLESFPEDESDLIAELAGNLLSEESNPEPVTLIAELDGEVAGHVAFSPVYASGEDKCLGYILAPLAVKPKYQKRGIGSKLVNGGISRLSERGINLFLVYGDPKYYGRFGFEAETASGFSPPCELQYPFGWLAILRGPGGSGEHTIQVSCVEPLRNPALW